MKNKTRIIIELSNLYDNMILMENSHSENLIKLNEIRQDIEKNL